MRSLISLMNGNTPSVESTTQGLLEAEAEGWGRGGASCSDGPSVCFDLLVGFCLDCANGQISAVCTCAACVLT